MIVEFLKPATTEDAVAMKRANPGSLYFAGGTDISHPDSERKSACVISLQALGLKTIRTTEAGVTIGSGVTLQQLIDAPQIPPVLKEAAGWIYSRNVRNMATVGGNIGANRADSVLIPCLMALGATLATAEGGLMPIADYVAGANSDLILAVQVENVDGACAIRKVARSVGAPMAVGVAVRIAASANRISKAVIAVAGTADRVVRLNEIEASLEAGQVKPGEALQQAVSDAVSPQVDVSGSVGYKKYICGVAVADCVSACLK